MTKYRGEQFILEIKSETDADFRLVTCLSSAPFSESSEMISTTTRENDGWATELATNQSYTIELSGFMVRDGADGNGFYSYHELRKLKRERKIFEWRIIVQGGYNIDYGRAIIPEISYEDTAGELVEFTATMRGFGKPSEGTNRVYVLGSTNPNEIYTYNNNNAIKA